MVKPVAGQTPPKPICINQLMRYRQGATMQVNSRDEFADNRLPANQPIAESGAILKKPIRFSILRILAVLGFLSLPGIVVIIMAAPSILFGDCAQKAKQSEARTYIASILKAQEANFVTTKHFSSSIEALNIGIKTETANFKYFVSATPQASFSYGITQKGNLSSFVGAIFILPVRKAIATAHSPEVSAVSIICETKKTGNKNPGIPTYQNGQISCGQGTKEIKRS
jgi:type IV pilus assembly protein PilA